MRPIPLRCGSTHLLRNTPGAARAVGVVDAGKTVADVVGVIHFLPGSVLVAVQVFAFEAAQFVVKRFLEGNGF